MARSDDAILLASGDLYYYNKPDELTGRSFDIELLVAFDGTAANTSGWTYVDISGDKGSFDVYAVSKGEKPATSPDVFRLQVSFDEWPGMISIDNLAVSDDAKSADIQLNMKSVDLLVPAEETISVGQTSATTLTLTKPDDGISFASLQVRVLSGDTQLMGYASDDTTLSFDLAVKTGGIEITPKEGADLSSSVGETYHFALVGKSGENYGLMYTEGSRNVKVLGIETSKDMVVSFDVTVTESGGGNLLSLEYNDVPINITGLSKVLSKDFRTSDHTFPFSHETELVIPGFAHVMNSSRLVSMDVPADISENMAAALPLTATIKLTAIPSTGNPSDGDFQGSAWTELSATDKAALLDSKGYALHYEFIEPATFTPDSPHKVVSIVGAGSGLPWSKALSEKYVSFSETHDLRVNYVIVDGDSGVSHDGGLIYIPDGHGNRKLLDPLWFTKSTPGYHSDSGCDAGFGAFALLALAGAAAILRRKG